MFGWLTGRVNVRLHLTNASFQRWMGLVRIFGLPIEHEGQILRRAIGFYLRTTDLKGNPLFVRDGTVEFIPCSLREYTTDPEGPWAYDRPWSISDREWRMWKRAQRQAGDPDISTMVDRALQLYERFVYKRLPTLFTVDDYGEFIEIEFYIA